MKLIHYSSQEVTKVHAGVERQHPFKPHGLWVSDDDCEDNWHAWCMSKKFNLGTLTHVHSVEMTPGANVRILSSAAELEQFTETFRRSDMGKFPPSYGDNRRNIFIIDWDLVRAKYDGLIITPYIWSKRLELLWYYGWDCASGCIWNPDVVGIRLIEVREPIQVVEED